MRVKSGLDRFRSGRIDARAKAAGFYPCEKQPRAPSGEIDEVNRGDRGRKSLNTDSR